MSLCLIKIDKIELVIVNMPFELIFRTHRLTSCTIYLIYIFSISDIIPIMSTVNSNLPALSK